MNENAQANGDHEVHKEGCHHMPNAENRIFLGAFPNCYGAVAKAKKINYRADGCYFCSNDCHTS